MPDEFLFGIKIHGQPLPKSRPRSKAGQPTFTPKATRDAEKRIRDAFRQVYPDYKPNGEPLRLVARFYRKDKRSADTDNLLKLVTDALNGIAYLDDKQIEDIRGIRIYSAGENARTEIAVWAIHER